MVPWQPPEGLWAESSFSCTSQHTFNWCVCVEEQTAYKYEIKGLIVFLLASDKSIKPSAVIVKLLGIRLKSILAVFECSRYFQSPSGRPSAPQQVKKLLHIFASVFVSLSYWCWYFRELFSYLESRSVKDLYKMSE